MLLVCGIKMQINMDARKLFLKNGKKGLINNIAQ
jgi:hypothetical protein